ncbi:putative disease resistance protein RGA1 [Ziziphus jujuba]|uniref:Disease resistance protein RGA1 n=1 Tax=Ziziphus jujuba TaxID=326968 RepID=A0ABM4A1U1_ZIZJJ|nr:putative disease resistance protein RGA1 [Ziziphus jujuba]
MAWEVLLSSVADVIIKQLGEAIENEVALLSGVEDELQKLKDTVSTIKCVLADAEKKQVQEEQIKTWLRRLEGVVYEADDFVDEFSTDQTLRSQQEAMTGNTLAKKVRTFCCSTSFPLGFRHKMGRKIKDIRNKLDAIANDRKFHLVTGLQETEVVTAEWKDHSFQREEDTIGREDDKVEIKKRLFDMKTKENIGVIPIVGVGGLGKTTLAQLVFNDEEVQRHFEPKLWVSVPKVFDLELVVKEVFQSARQGERSTDITLDQMQKDIREKIKGKQFLLVLDDIWDLDNREKWLSLENLLRDGSSGSRIIVTTRDKEVARIINGPEEPPYILEALDDNKAWSLFEKLAFVQEPKDSIIVEIGKEIMKKCGGIPLVIRTIASMLYSRHVDEWSSFKEKELSTISQYDKDIIPRLKLSYDHLPSHLKRCFAYCSLFPKNHIIDVKKLINLWMAQGFIKLSNHQERPEDMGYQHFTDLLYRSFFEKVVTDHFLNKTKCKMHDCMHDLAMSVAGPQCVMLNLNVAAADDDKIETTTHHMSINFGLRDHQSFADFSVRAKRIRTILFNKCSYSSMLRLGNSLDKIDLQFKFLRTLGLSGLWRKTVPDSIGRLKHLRCLDLSFNSMKVLPESIVNLHNLQTLDLSFCISLEALPDSIGRLKHLRYLDLSCCESLEALPDSIVNLHNLQTLDLTYCGSLEALPVDIWKLVNLRHLYTGMTFEQIHLPRGLSQLTNLQALTKFLVKAEHGSQLNELRDLNNLRGHLTIRVHEDGIKSEGANLKSKQHLQSIELWIDGKMVDDCGDLVPHSNIKSFTLCGPYPGAALLNCVPSLKNLVEFKLSGHKDCQYIAALNHLPHLRVLQLWYLAAVEYISSDEYDDNVVDGNLLPFFPSLQRLFLIDIPNLKGWWKGVENTENTSRSLPFFPCLSELEIYGCPNLICMPLFPYLQELRLQGTRIKPFQQTLMMKNIVGPPTSSDKASSSSSASSAALLPLSTLKILTIDDIDDIHELQYFPDGFITLTSLKKLSIVNCSKLKYLFPGLHHLISLQQLDIHDCKELEMPNEDSDAILWRHLQSLSILSLYKLPKLVALPEGLQQVTSLQEIIIFNCEILEAVLECVKSLKSLRRLVIKDCPSLMCLPEGIDGLTSLKNLEIVRCPILLEKCLEDTGEYWPMISHIKNRRLVDF